jgi:hypothetical protein
MPGYPKNKLIEQVYLRVTGGSTNKDSDVETVDIEPYVEAAIRFVHTKHYYEFRQAEGYGFDESSLETYTATLADTERGFKTINLGFTPLILPGGMAIDSIIPEEGYVPLVRIRGQQWLSGLDRLCNTTFYWIEGSKAFVYNAGKMCNLIIRAIPDPGSLGPEDIVKLPAGKDIEVVNIATEYFTGQRTMPADITPNNRDEVNQRT